MRDDGGYGGPYSSETSQNTNTDWLDDMTPVEAKLDGMSDYAKSLMTVAGNLQSHQLRVIQQLSSLEADAFQGGFPEVNYAQKMHNQNFAEFRTYLMNLYTGISNNGNAAQAVADSFGDADGFSAIDLNTVQFAFADPNASRPAGLPQGVGETYMDAQLKAQAAGNAPVTGTGSTHPDAVWTRVSGPSDPNGTGTFTYTNQYHEQQTITVTVDASGQRTTVTKGPGGTSTVVESGYSYEFGSAQDSTRTDAKGKVTTSQQYTTYDGNTTTVEQMSGGKVTGITTTTYNSDGSETDNSYSVDDKGNRVEQSSVTVGHDNDVQLGTQDSPAIDAMNQQKALMK